MSFRFGQRWLSFDFWFVALLLAGMVGLGYWAVVRFIQPAPPRHIVMTVGPESGGYEGFAKDFKAILARDGIEVELRATNGAQDDLRLLNDPASDVSVALVQGGVAQDSDGENLMSLASLYYEPVWVFYRRGLQVDRLSSLKGLRIGLGPRGSGMNTLGVQLFNANGLDSDNTRFEAWPPEEAAQRLLDRKLDAVLLVGAPESSLIYRVMMAPGINLLSFKQADAYSRLFSYLTRVVLPAGGFDLGQNIPAHQVELVAPTAILVVRDTIHPALITLLMQASSEIFGGDGLFQREGDFPSPKGVDIPLSLDADHYMKAGPSFLHRHLPFWIAVWIDRLIVFVIPALALLVPLFRFAPTIYSWRVRSRIYRWYGKLKKLEFELDVEKHGVDVPSALAKLDEVEKGVSQIRTPLSYSEHLYNLRAHIELVRQRIQKLSASS
ncbi:MAG: ABC transporter substrate-binding protein [Aquabacterium sp.]|nr:ABC transporter substrate-binding protein [Aquabacterium sp.]